MLPPRLASTLLPSRLGVIPRSPSCLPLLRNAYAGSAARGPGLRFGGGDSGARAASSSSTRWKTRQGKDAFAREAKVQGLKSRAAFKLLEIDVKYRIFKRGQTVVDLGYAPGSWSQVAVERTKPTGRILGIDIIPAQPPKGVSTIQGNFLSTAVQESVKQFLLDPDRGRPRRSLFAEDTEEIEPEFSDHAGSMDLCAAALRFAFDTLRPGGHFLKKLFGAVHREKPESSRSESKEAYFVALRRKRVLQEPR
ncbi:hypothetical protein DID88_006844 [Monilinia fructigena]|uniref:rRNA methyltransferase 2, mitochondrial n=1 Tax=Monilinia fructigena TaxID=38457 RepID=A0A395IHH2_9HELO|nr:hypothetical protein DID88_006844 [Monilinia fructigena]